MTTREAINDFLGQRTLAVVGASRDPKKFGNVVFREMQSKGYEVYPVNCSGESINGVESYQDLRALPTPVDGVILVIPPTESAQVVREAADLGIRRVWMQQGAESEEAIQFCETEGVSAVHGECIMMFAEPVKSVHRFHRWIWGLLGRLPN